VGVRSALVEMRELVKGRVPASACDRERPRTGMEARERRETRDARDGKDKRGGREPVFFERERRRGGRTRAFVSAHMDAGRNVDTQARAPGARARAPRPRSAACDLTRDGEDRPRCTGSVHGGRARAAQRRKFPGSGLSGMIWGGWTVSVDRLRLG